VHGRNAGQESEEAGHQGIESGRALRAADCMGGVVHERWGRGAAVHMGREVRGLEGHIRDGGMVEVVGGGPWTARRAGVRRRCATRGSAGAAAATAVASAVCASMRAFMSAICPRTSASVSRARKIELY
jgi:hypothetical protein